MATRFLLIHKEHGVYLGNCMGLGFWSKLDAADQDAAVTFPSRKSAYEHTSDWTVDDAFIQSLTVAPVDADLGDYASIAACVAAGQEPWLTVASDVEGTTQ